MSEGGWFCIFIVSRNRSKMLHDFRIDCERKWKKHHIRESGFPVSQSVLFVTEKSPLFTIEKRKKRNDGGFYHAVYIPATDRIQTQEILAGRHSCNWIYEKWRRKTLFKNVARFRNREAEKHTSPLSFFCEFTLVGWVIGHRRPQSLSEINLIFLGEDRFEKIFSKNLGKFENPYITAFIRGTGLDKTTI